MAQQMLEAAQSLLSEHSTLSRVVCVGDPSDAQRPFAIHFDALLAQALITSCFVPQRSASVSATGHDVSLRAQCPPPTPLSVIAAAEKWLKRCSASGKVLHVVVPHHSQPLWPSATLQLVRICLLIHLTHCAAQPLQRLKLVHLGTLHNSNVSGEGAGSNGKEGASGDALAHHLASVFPAALLLLDSTALQHMLHSICTVAGCTGKESDTLYPLAAEMSNAELAAGISNVAVVGLDDVYTEGTGTFAPVTRFSEAGSARTAALEHLQTCAAQRAQGDAHPPAATPGMTMSAQTVAKLGSHALEDCAPIWQHAWPLHCAVIASDAVPLRSRALNVKPQSPEAWSKLAQAIDAVAGEVLPELRAAWQQLQDTAQSEPDGLQITAEPTQCALDRP